MGIFDTLRRSKSLPPASTRATQVVEARVVDDAETKVVSVAGDQAVINQILGAWYASRALPRRGSFELLVAYRNSPHLRSVVSRIAVSCATPSWRVYTQGKAAKRPVKSYLHGNQQTRRMGITRGVQSGDLVELPDHPLAKLLARPNPEHGGVAARRLDQAYRELVGESFSLLELDARGAPVEMWPIPTHWVRNVPRGGAGADSNQTFEIAWNGKSVQVPRQRMLWIRELDPVDPYLRGSGVGYALGDELDTDEYAAKMAKAHFKNHGMPAWLLTAPGMAPNALAEVRQGWEERNRGADRAGRAHWINTDVKAQRLDEGLEQQGLIGIREFEAAVVRETWNVPPEVVGHMESSNRATAQAALENLGRLVVAPRLEFLRSEYQEKLVPMFPDGDRLILEFDDPIPPDQAARLDAARAAPWALSQNEWRALQGLEPIDGGDDRFLVGGTVISSTDMDTPDPPPQQPQFQPPADPQEPPPDSQVKAIGKVIRDEDLDVILGAISPVEIGETMATIIETLVHDFGTEQSVSVGVGAHFSMVAPNVVSHLAEFSSTRIKMINDTTRDQIRAELVSGVANGEGIGPLSRRVRAVFDEAKTSRATLIARTEVIRSSNFARLEAMQMAGEDIVPGKRWLATQDSRTRDTHAAMDGQKRKVDEAFSSPSGAQAQHPGGFGVAKEDCNCRCTIVPMVDWEAEGRDVSHPLWTNWARLTARWEHKAEDALHQGFDRQEQAVLRALEKFVR